MQFHFNWINAQHELFLNSARQGKFFGRTQDFSVLRKGFRQKSFFLSHVVCIARLPFINLMRLCYSLYFQDFSLLSVQSTISFNMIKMPLFGKSQKSPAEVVKALKEAVTSLEKGDKKLEKVSLQFRNKLFTGHYLWKQSNGHSSLRPKRM